MILVDTSAWIEFFRGRGTVADCVEQLLAEDNVVLCGPIVTELRRGFRSKHERDRVLPLLLSSPLLTEPLDLWAEAGELGFWLGRKGATVKSFDLLIASFALAHRVPLLTNDADFRLMVKVGVPLALY